MRYIGVPELPDGELGWRVSITVSVILCRCRTSLSAFLGPHRGPLGAALCCGRFAWSLRGRQGAVFDGSGDFPNVGWADLLGTMPLQNRVLEGGARDWEYGNILVRFCDEINARDARAEIIGRGKYLEAGILCGGGHARCERVVETLVSCEFRGSMIGLEYALIAGYGA